MTATMRDLPIPASPSISTTCPDDAAASFHRAFRVATCRVLPIKGVTLLCVVGVACSRLKAGSAPSGCSSSI